GRRVIKQSKNDARPSDSRVVVSTIPTTKPRKATKKPQIQKKSTKKTVNELICPKNAEKHVGWFALPCTNNKSCQIMGKKHVCCKVNNYKRCILGVPKPISEPRHEPILGLIQQKCPKTPLAELFWEIKTCDTDADCWPRVCCPDGQRKYCRSATVELQKSDIPFARSLANPLEAMSGYIQCTPPPPAQFDLYPKPCNNTLDCFPNVCCQEKGRKHCRPPKRSLLALITTMTQNVSAQWLKEWASNLVIP
uniref:WAP domain-containing protein n=1 Tax=Phlebotomus papatasi TaxID=29031 RepID=A0A1B0GPB9_PHLPP